MWPFSAVWAIQCWYTRGNLNAVCLDLSCVFSVTGPIFLVYFKTVSRFVLGSLEVMRFLQIWSNPNLWWFWNAIQIWFRLLDLSLDALAAHIRFHCVFCDTCSMTHNKDMKSRETEEYQDGWAESMLLLAERYGRQFKQEQTWSHAETNCLLCNLTVWHFGRLGDWPGFCFAASPAY